MGPCPLRGNCLVKSVVYKAEVINSNLNRETGLTANTFKRRFYKHRDSFRKEDSEHSTTLSSYIWDLKHNNENFEIYWTVKDRGAPFNPVSNKVECQLKFKIWTIFYMQAQIKISISEYLDQVKFLSSIETTCNIVLLFS